MKPTACSESHEHDLESSGSGTGGASKTDEFSEMSNNYYQYTSPNVHKNSKSLISQKSI